MNLLIVDDQATNLKLLRAQLEAEGYAVAEARDGVDAMAGLERGKVDAVITELLMPRMDGYQLCCEIRKHPRLRDLPIIIYTATSPSDEQLALDVGANKYIRKPVSIEALVAALREVIANPHTGLRAEAMPEAEVPKEYNEALVTKLEKENAELQQALETLRLAHGEILELNRDLERRVAERTLDLEAANKEMESFSHSVAHDLRTPLGHIDFFAAQIIDGYSEGIDAKGRGFLEIVRNSARRMEQLIDDILLLARVRYCDLRRDCVNISDIAQVVAAALQLKEPGRKVVFDLQAGLAVDADSGLLRLVIDNLLGNAWKFTAKTVEPRVEFGVTERAEGAVFFVRDNGAGFDMTYVERLFNPLERLHSEAEFPGTGIGLATVRRIINRHGGRVWAEGAVSRGATVFFTLPSLETGGRK